MKDPQTWTMNGVGTDYGSGEQVGWRVAKRGNWDNCNRINNKKGPLSVAMNSTQCNYVNVWKFGWSGTFFQCLLTYLQLYSLKSFHSMNFASQLAEKAVMVLKDL